MQPIRQAVSYWHEMVLALAAALMVLLPVSPLVREFASRDSGVFLYMGWRLLNGEVPYRDVWDHKPPMVFVIDAMGLGMGNGSVWGVWILEVVFLMVAVSLSLRSMRKLFGSHVALLATSLWVVNLIYLLAGGNLTEEYTLPMQYGLLLLFWSGERRGEYGRLGVLMGVISALIFFTRQTSIGIPVAIVLYLVAARWRRGEMKRMWRELGSMVIGGLLVVVPLVVYLTLNQALLEFWDAAFVFNMVYIGERGMLNRFVALWSGFRALLPTGLILFAGLGWTAIIWQLIKKHELPLGIKPMLLLAGILLPVEVGLVSLGGRPRIPYFVTLLPTLGLLSGYLLWLVYAQLANRKINPGVITGMLLLGLAALNWNAYLAGIADSHTDEGMGEVVNFVETHSGPGDYVLMIGAETAVNFHALRRSPSRYVYQYPLYRGGYTDDIELASFFEDILNKQPRIIIVALEGGEIPNRFGPNKTAESEALTHEINSLYAPVEEFGNGWVAYEPLLD